MKWLEIAVTVDGEAAEAVSEVFNRYNGGEGGYGGAVIAMTGFHERDDIPQTPTVTVSTFLPWNDGRLAERRRHIEEALWHLSQIYPLPEPRINEVAEQDWANAWKAHFHAFRIGQRIHIVPSWEDVATQPADVVIHLDPGMAFGTGLHPTTRLCLLALERWLRPGDRVLDVGVGSGILSIAAAKMGAASVLGLDIDPVAVRSARENVERNGVAPIVQVAEGSAAEARAQAGDGFDLALVNILAEVIIDLLAQGLADVVRPGGLLAFSGIINTKENQVLGALDHHDLMVIERRQEDVWVALVARRP